MLNTKPTRDRIKAFILFFAKFTNSYRLQQLMNNNKESVNNINLYNKLYDFTTKSCIFDKNMIFG